MMRVGLKKRRLFGRKVLHPDAKAGVGHKIGHGAISSELRMPYADKHAHAWRKYLDLSKIDMGSGDRVLADGGKLHPKYRITVPADLTDSEESDGA